MTYIDTLLISIRINYRQDNSNKYFAGLNIIRHDIPQLQKECPVNLSNNGNSNSVRSVYIEPMDSPVESQREALSYWENKRGDRLAPAWSEISLMDFPPKVIPAIMVTDIDQETGTLKYRFFGTQLTELHGGDYTGKSPADLQPKQI